MNTSPETWIELLSYYGPAALFVFFAYVVFRLYKIVSNWSRITTTVLPSELKKIQIFAFAGVWLSIFVLAVVIVVAWWQIHFPKEFVVQGTISNLTYPQTITSDQPIFFRREMLAYPDFQYEWRIISPVRFTQMLEFQLQKGSGSTMDGTLLLKYKVQIRADFYSGDVNIDYVPDNDTMVLSHGSYTEKINPTISVATETTGSSLTSATQEENIVFASTRREPKPQELIVALDVDDPQIRASAKRELIHLGPKAIPYLGQSLVDADSYRLRVGILSALKEMGSSTQSLNETARCVIAKLSRDPDAVLSGEARDVIATGIALPSACPDTALSTHVNLDDPIAIDSGRPPVFYAVGRRGVITVLHEAHNSFTERRRFMLPGTDVPSDLASSTEADSVFICVEEQIRQRFYIVQYSPEGKVLRRWYLHRSCGGIAFDPQEQVIYFSTPNSRDLSKIEVGQNSGELGVGQIHGATNLGSLAVDPLRQRIYVADLTSGSVYEYNLLTKRSQNIADHFGEISALRIDPNRNLLFVADSGHKCIVSVKIDVDPPFTGTCSRNLAFRMLTGLATTQSGMLAASDASANAILTLSSDGHIVSKYP